MLVPMWLHWKRADVFIPKKFKVVWSQMSLWGNSLVGMYAKCGSLEDAWRTFSKMPSWDMLTWTAIFEGCAMHGHVRNSLTFCTDVFRRCTGRCYKLHLLFVSWQLVAVQVCWMKACIVYASMTKDHMISAKLKHYTCMIDRLGHAGHVQEAKNMIRATP